MIIYLISSALPIMFQLFPENRKFSGKKNFNDFNFYLGKAQKICFICVYCNLPVK